MKLIRTLAVSCLLVSFATVFSGCPGAFSPYLGVWYFNDTFSAGDFAFELLANGNVVQLDDDTDEIPGDFKWDLLPNSTLVFYQDDGVNRSILTGAFLTNESVTGVSVQTEGAGTGTKGSWSLVRSLI